MGLLDEAQAAVLAGNGNGRVHIVELDVLDRVPKRPTACLATKAQQGGVVEVVGECRLGMQASGSAKALPRRKQWHAPPSHNATWLSTSMTGTRLISVSALLRWMFYSAEVRRGRE